MSYGKSQTPHPHSRSKSMAYRKLGTKKHKAKLDAIYPYKSGLEYRLHKTHLTEWQYEPVKLNYTTERVYTPDFVLGDRKIMIEAKGFFKPGDQQKYTSIAACNPDWEMIFIFQKPETPMPSAKIRANGTKQTMAEWAGKQGFMWFSETTAKSIGKVLRDRDNKRKKQLESVRDSLAKGEIPSGD